MPKPTGAPPRAPARRPAPPRARRGRALAAPLALVALASVVGCTAIPPPATRPPGPTTTVPGSTAWRTEMLTSVNAQRTAAGLRPLAPCAALNRAAQSYAQVLAGWGVLSHTGPDGSTVTSRIQAAGYRPTGSGYTGWAENIAMGYPSVSAVMTGWMGSAGHRANILSPSLTHLGTGRATGSGSTWWVQDFGVGGTC